VENGYIVISRYLLKAIDPWSVQCVDWRIERLSKTVQKRDCHNSQSRKPSPATQRRAVIGNKEHGNVPLKILESFIIKPYAQMAT
jgi:hypothetical protein